MENFWDFSVWGWLILVGILLSSLLIANVLKRRVPFLKNSLIFSNIFSTASIVGAYKLGSGVEEGLVTLAKNNPEAFATVLSDCIAPFKWLIFAMLFLALWPFGKWLWKRSNIHFSKSGNANVPKSLPESTENGKSEAE